MENKDTKHGTNEFAEYLTTEYKNMKPLSEFIDYQRINIPKTIELAKERACKNLEVFKSNYFVFLAIFGLFLVFFNSFLLVLALVWVGFAYLNSRDIKYNVKGIEIGAQQFLFIAIGLSVLLLLFMRSYFMFFCSALLIGGGLVFTHALLYDTLESSSEVETV